MAEVGSCQDKTEDEGESQSDPWLCPGCSDREGQPPCEQPWIPCSMAGQDPRAGKNPRAGKGPRAGKDPTLGKDPTAGQDPTAGRVPWQL